MSALSYYISPSSYSLPQSVKEGLKPKERKLSTGDARDNQVVQNAPAVSNGQKLTTSFINISESSSWLPMSSVLGGNTQQYRRYLISRKLKQAIPLFNDLMKSLGSSASVIIVVEINKIVNETWDITSQEDGVDALLLTSLENLLKGSNWKLYEKDDISKIIGILERYTDIEHIIGMDEITNLLSMLKINILPAIDEQ